MLWQIEGTQATRTDLINDKAGFSVSNTDDIEEVTNYLRAFRLVQDKLRDPASLPLSVRLNASTNTHVVVDVGQVAKG